MKLYAIRVFVHDWDAACHFYRGVLGLREGFSDANLGWAEFDVGGARLGIERVADHDLEAASLVGRFLGISLMVDDIDEAYQCLRDRGVAFDGPPQKQPWGEAWPISKTRLGTR